MAKYATVDEHIAVDSKLFADRLAQAREIALAA
jgi:hypothetical protein